ncbi:hypothetical protein NL526_27575, partial [Klebsiella pneumoniae]|nr:hypothetical protein [Klebsiella pneumoniae]
GTAHDGLSASSADYVASAGCLIFSAGETAKSIWIPTYSQPAGEADEAFLVELSDPSGVVLQNTFGVGRIQPASANDCNLGLTLSISDSTVTA